MDEIQSVQETSLGEIVVQAVNKNGNHLLITIINNQVNLQIKLDDSDMNFVLNRADLARLILTPVMQRVLGEILDNPNWYLT